MNILDINDLNKNFSIDSNQHLKFKMGDGGIPLVEIENEFATAVISLQGAHVLSWIPKGEVDVIWLSTDATFAMGKSVRGGVPICWPWFGAHESDTHFPAHGFARTVLWTVKQTQALECGETQILFELDTSTLDETLQAMWPQATLVVYKITIGQTLTLELITTNKSEESFTLGQALHTYFNVSDIEQTTVTGLEGKDYLDKTTGFERKTQDGNIIIKQEVDRIYLQTADAVVIDDAKRKIKIEKKGSLSTVVWNPWQDVANKMGDLGTEGYRHMLCVESANAADDIITIAPDESHTLQVCYSVYVGRPCLEE